MKKKLLALLTAGLSIMMLAGCGESGQYGYEDAEYFTLNKCDASMSNLLMWVSADRGVMMMNFL